METQAEYLERARAAFKIKSDAHIAREIGISRQHLHRFKIGEMRLAKHHMLALANRAGLDPDEALVLRALWAADIDKIPNYSKHLRKFAGVFLAGLVAFASPNELNLNDNLEYRQAEARSVFIMRNIILSLLALLLLPLVVCLQNLITLIQSDPKEKRKIWRNPIAA